MKNTLRAWQSEARSIIRNPRVLIPVIAVILVPVLYSGLFLGAFWDPYDRLDDLPVAVVNEDAGAELNGRSLQIGDDFAAKLEDNPEFDWHFVSKAEAEAGMADNRYYLTIEIPEDFSANAATLISDEPKPAELIYRPNESYNFLGAQIGGTAVDRIRSSLNKEITKTYTSTVFERLEELAGGLGQAGDGAGQLADGVADATDGAQTIRENLAKLAGGTVTLQDGVAKLAQGGTAIDEGAASLAAGTAQLADGLRQLQAADRQLLAGAEDASRGAASLAAGAGALGDGLTQLSQGGTSLAASAGEADQAMNRLAAGAAQSAAGAAQLDSGAAELAQGLAALAKQQPQLAADPGFQKLLAGSQQLAEGMAASHTAQQQLAEGAQQLSGGLGKLAEGAGTFDTKLAEAAAAGRQLAEGGTALHDGVSKLAAGLALFDGKLGEAAGGGASAADGAAQLASGAGELRAGLNELLSKTGPLADGTGRLAEGATSLETGLLQIRDGAEELAGKLGDAAEQTASLNHTEATDERFAEPVVLNTQKMNEVPNYGTGFAPYFMSLGLFVGALLLTIVYNLNQPAAGLTASGWQWFSGKALTLAVIGIVQALVVDVVMIGVLDLQVANMTALILYSILTSLTFMMIIQFLVTTLQNPGRFLAIVLLIFQLTSSAGTFPLELIPGWLQTFTPWLPMTYSVAGLKAVISSGDIDAIWRNSGALAAFALISAAGTAIFTSVLQRRRNHKDRGDAANVVNPV